LGSKSTVIVLISVVLAVIGLPRLITHSIIATNVLLGFVITLLTLLVLQPTWVQHATTFARYMLPIIPTFLMAVACGTTVISKKIIAQSSNNSPFWYFTVFLIAFFLMSNLAQTPALEVINKPNSYSQHLTTIFEFRKGRNEIQQFMDKRPISEYWKSLSYKPLSVKIAVTPWYYGSFHWDAPIWEKISRQRIVPGFLLGLCTDSRYGEAPKNAVFDFQNYAYIGNKKDVAEKNIDLIVYQKKARLNFDDIYGTLVGCETAIENIYNKPVYEDEYIKVYKTN
jgi:hypothetical protein